MWQTHFLYKELTCVCCLNCVFLVCVLNWNISNRQSLFESVTSNLKNWKSILFSNSKCKESSPPWWWMTTLVKIVMLVDMLCNFVLQKKEMWIANQNILIPFQSPAHNSNLIGHSPSETRFSQISSLTSFCALFFSAFSALAWKVSQCETFQDRGRRPLKKAASAVMPNGKKMTFLSFLR